MCCSSGGGRECLAQGAGNSTVCCKRSMKAKGQLRCCSEGGPCTGLRDAKGRAAGRSRSRVRAGLLCAVSSASVFPESFDFAAISEPRGLTPSCRSSSFVVSLPPSRRRVLQGTSPLGSDSFWRRSESGHLRACRTSQWHVRGVFDSSSVHAALLSTALPSSPRLLPPGV